MPRGHQSCALAALLLGGCAGDAPTRLRAGPNLRSPSLAQVYLADVMSGPPLDVVATSATAASVESALYVFSGDGTGAFQDPVITEGVHALSSMADVNSDSTTDYLGDKTLWLGTDGGTATKDVTFDVAVGDAGLIYGSIADLTGEGATDVVFGEPVTGPPYDVVSIIEGDGAGGFAAKQQFAIPPPAGLDDFYPLITARLTDDPAVDVLRASTTGIDALVSRGERTFTASPGLITVSSDLQSSAKISRIVPIDVDRDGLDDVAFTALEGSVLFARNLGGDGFSEVTILVDGSVPGATRSIGCESGVDRCLSAADVDADGCLDLVFLGRSESDERYVFAMLSACGTRFSEPLPLARTDAGAFAAGDIDGDHSADVVTTSGELFLSGG